MASYRCFLVALTLMIAVESEARPATPAPPLPPPAGTVVNVSTEAQLQTAVRSIRSGTTIVIAPGVYTLTRTLSFNGSLRNIGIRGATNNADDVFLLGPGMTQAAYVSVPFGIWTGNGVDGVTIANLTLRGFYFHCIILNGGTEKPLIHNVHLVDSGEQFIKSNPDEHGVGASNGVLEYSRIEFTTTARDEYPKGIDAQGGANWIVRHNLFRNIVAPGGRIAGPSVFIWRGSSNPVVDGNLFLNCSRGVMFGGPSGIASEANSGGVIRNNMFFRAANQPGDAGIMVFNSPGTQVQHNTVFVSGTYATPIEYRFPTATNVLIANNLLDGRIAARNGASGAERGNYTGATASMFVDGLRGDLHLSATAAAAIDQASTSSVVADDWDGEVRPTTSASDIGADER